MALSINQLTAKKVRLNEQLNTIEETTTKKVNALIGSFEIKIAELTEAHEAKVKATAGSVADRKVKIAKEIEDVDTLLEQQIATLQAQIDAIKAVNTPTVEANELPESEDNNEGELV